MAFGTVMHGSLHDLWDRAVIMCPEFQLSYLWSAVFTEYFMLGSWTCRMTACFHHRRPLGPIHYVLWPPEIDADCKATPSALKLPEMHLVPRKPHRNLCVCVATRDVVMVVGTSAIDHYNREYENWNTAVVSRIHQIFRSSKWYTYIQKA